MTDIFIEDYTKGLYINELEDTLQVDLVYPRSNRIKHVEVGLIDVRASDGVRISYDYERDGWVIEQPRSRQAGEDIVDFRTAWIETAFVRSWVLQDE